MFLLDTNVISALRRPDRNPRPVEWLREQRDFDLFVSVVTIVELEKGIANERRKNPDSPDFAQALTRWSETIHVWFADRIVPVDASTARRWGRLIIAMGNKNIDLLIAATALEHGLTVVTGNVVHFEPTGVPILNPFEFGRLSDSPDVPYSP